MKKNKLLILGEYFELSAKLNKSNPIKNKIKEIHFYTTIINQEEQLFAAISNWQKLTLCRKVRENYWLPMQISGYDNLEPYLCRILPECHKQPDLTKCIKFKLFSLQSY